MTWLPLVSATLVLLGIVANAGMLILLRAALRRVEALERAAADRRPRKPTYTPEQEAEIRRTYLPSTAYLYFGLPMPASPPRPDASRPPQGDAR